MANLTGQEVIAVALSMQSMTVEHESSPQSAELNR
jgi:hypothetical protein